MVLAFMDTISFVDYCLFIVSEFQFLNAPFVFYDFNHVLFIKYAVLYHTSVLCIDHHTYFVRNDGIKMSSQSYEKWYAEFTHTPIYCRKDN